MWFSNCKSRSLPKHKYILTQISFNHLTLLIFFLGFPSGSVGEGNGTPLSTLAWQISWMEEPGRLQSMGLLGVGHD